MSRTAVDRRYGRAMVELCDEQGNHDAIRADFDRLAAVLEDGPEVVDFLANPVVPEADRRKLLEDMLGQLGVTGPIANLARLLLDKGRFGAMPGIHATFSDLIDGRTGRLQATVTSAVALDEVALARVHGMLAKRFNKQVVLETQVDESLIGGLVIQIGNTVYDGSVRNHFERLRDQMMSGYAQ